MNSPSKGSAKHSNTNPVFLAVISSTAVIFIVGWIRMIVLQWRLDHNPPMIVDPDGFVGPFILLSGCFIVPVAALISGIASSGIKTRNPKMSQKEVGRSAAITGAAIGALLSLVAFFVFLAQ